MIGGVSSCRHRTGPHPAEAAPGRAFHPARQRFQVPHAQVYLARRAARALRPMRVLRPPCPSPQASHAPAKLPLHARKAVYAHRKHKAPPAQTHPSHRRPRHYLQKSLPARPGMPRPNAPEKQFASAAYRRGPLFNRNSIPPLRCQPGACPQKTSHSCPRHATSHARIKATCASRMQVQIPHHRNSIPTIAAGLAGTRKTMHLLPHRNIPRAPCPSRCEHV